MKPVLVFAFTLFFSSTASAILIERDLFSSGDGLLTYDTETGLEWLDESALPSLTWTELIQGVGGWTDLGFRIADYTETWQLLLNAGADHLVSAPSYASGNNQNTKDGHLLLSSFGISSSFVTPEFTNHTQGSQNTSVNNAQIGSFADLFTDYQFGDAISWDDSYFIRYYEPSAAGGSYIYAFDQGSTGFCNIVGNDTPTGCPSFNTAIVRESPVPLPAAAWLLLSAIAGLLAAKKKHHYRPRNIHKYARVLNCIQN